MDLWLMHLLAKCWGRRWQCYGTGGKEGTAIKPSDTCTHPSNIFSIQPSRKTIIKYFPIPYMTRARVLWQNWVPPPK
jgi:hypothetical protein